MADVREHEAAPTGEHVHMPEPSIIPILNAAGLAIAIVGVTLSRVIIVLGLLLFLGTTIRWVRDTRRDIDELPLEHH